MKYMKNNNLFLIFKNNKIDNVEILQNEIKEINYTISENKITNFTTSQTSKKTISIVKNNKRAIINFDQEINTKNISFIIDSLLTAIKLTNKKGIIFNKKKKYQKYNFFNQKLEKIDSKEKINKIIEIGKSIKNYSPLIQDVKITYSEQYLSKNYCNSKNINLKNKFNLFTIDSFVLVKNKNTVKTHELSFNDNNFVNFDAKTYVKKICDEAIQKLNFTSIKTGKYKTIFDSNITDIFLEYYISQLNAEKIKKNLSWFKNKINTKVANEKITILDMPLQKGINFTAYDDQGYPASNQVIIKNGILQTYLHTLETAQEFHTSPTGHAVNENSSINANPHNLCLKPGLLNKEQLIQKIQNGIYITSIEGLHAGMNIETGNFSLKSEGFIIQNGKIGPYIDMMIVNSNLYDIFQKIKIISQNIEYSKNFFAPCIYLDDIFISCE